MQTNKLYHIQHHFQHVQQFKYLQSNEIKSATNSIPLKVRFHLRFPLQSELKTFHQMGNTIYDAFLMMIKSNIFDLQANVFLELFPQMENHKIHTLANII